ncbi:hypothetical protein AVEN_68387-2-1, partial [Araneus ventricosus]
HDDYDDEERPEDKPPSAQETIQALRKTATARSVPTRGGTSQALQRIFSSWRLPGSPDPYKANRPVSSVSSHTSHVSVVHKQGERTVKPYPAHEWTVKQEN